MIDPSDTRPSFAATEDRLAQTSSATASSTISYDYSQYLQGTYFLSGGIAYDVIASEYWEDEIVGYLQTDLNHDDADEMILRDGHSIYIKYANDNQTHEPHLAYGDEGDVRYIDM
ncbi:MAG: hypothetical protein H6766_07075 [Candidatus Peribacteria bacterium]|nr:MAG: hypothetical protein H6766_07075 [Candidatus Peribacteria bacterium]